MNNDHSVKIGKYLLALPPGHGLAQIHENFPQYQVLPWKSIENFLSGRDHNETIFLDFGSNIGDSIAYISSFFQGNIAGFEADSNFFGYLKQNIEQMDYKNVKISNTLLVEEKNSSYNFAASAQTGSIITRKTKKSTLNFTIFEDPGEMTTPADLISELLGYKEIFIKSDLDGYDSSWINAVRKQFGPLFNKVSLVFLEGPTEEQMMSFLWIRHIKTILRLMDDGFECSLWTNIGSLYLEKTSSKKKVLTSFYKLHRSLRKGRGLAHYFDVIAYR